MAPKKKGKKKDDDDIKEVDVDALMDQLKTGKADSPIETPTPASPKAKAKSKGKQKSKSFQESDSEDDDAPVKAKAKSKGKQKSKSFQESDSEDDDAPVKAKAKSKGKQKSKSFQESDSEDDDEDEEPVIAKPQPKRSAFQMSMSDSDDDDDNSGSKSKSGSDKKEDTPPPSPPKKEEENLMDAAKEGRKNKFGKKKDAATKSADDEPKESAAAPSKETEPKEESENLVDMFGKKSKKKDKREKEKQQPIEEEPKKEEPEPEQMDFGKKKKGKRKDEGKEEGGACAATAAASSSPQGGGGLMVGLIEEIRKIPKKDKYSVCQVRIGATRRVQIVTTVEVTLNSKVTLAVAPCVLQGRPVEARKTAKEDSEGMFVGPLELGWGPGSGFDETAPVPMEDYEVGDPIPSLEEVKAKKQKNADVDAAALNTSGGAKKGKKSKGPVKMTTEDDDELDALLGEFGVKVSEAPVEEPKGKKGKKKGGAAAAAAAQVEDAPKEEDDLDALLGEFGVNIKEAPEQHAAKKKGKKGKAAAAAGKTEEDLDLILNEFKSPEEEAAVGSAAASSSALPPADEKAEAEGEDNENNEEGGDVKLTAKQIANRKKRDQKKAAKAAQQAGGEGLWGGEEKKNDLDYLPEVGKDAKKNKRVNKALEHLQLMKELEEEKRAFDEAEKKRVEEEERKIREEEEEKKRKRDAKKAAKEANIAKKKAEGTYMTKAEKEKKESAERYKEMLRQQGVVAEEEKEGITVTITEELKELLATSLIKQNNKWVLSEEIADQSLEKWAMLDVPATWEKDALEAGEELFFLTPKKKAVYSKKKKVVQPKSMAASGEAGDASAAAAAPSPGKTDKAAEAKSHKSEASSKRSSKTSVVADWEMIAETTVSLKISSDIEESEASDSESDGGSSSSSSSSSSSEDSFLGLRSPICCIMGHVDTGKTKLLDKIRRTNVQEGEAGGITQQIGATFFPQKSLIDQSIKVDKEFEVDVPGLLIIDTPGHESFNNLRKRGSSLADIAILVIDIMHGLEPQTVESLEMLKKRKCPFVIALNKVDRLYEWKSREYVPIQESLFAQEQFVQQEFDKRMQECILQLTEKGLNCRLWWENEDLKRNVSVVPTSAMTGEGVPDLLHLILKITQSQMSSKLEIREELECTVLEVKNIEGLGTTCDVILINGELKVDDKIVLCSLNGPIVTHVRALLTPEPLKEMRIKGDYVRHRKIDTSMGVKIVANNLDNVVAGTALYVCGPDDDLEDLKEDVMEDFEDILDGFDKQTEGVYVMASTLGSLEALLSFLKTSKIPVFAVNIGDVQKLDIKKAGLMKEKKHPEYAVVLAFDVKVNADARKLADKEGIKIMTADIIYHLFDQFTDYMKQIDEAKKKNMQKEAVFPCVLKIIPTFIFNKRDPIIVGVDVLDGQIRIGTPLCIPNKLEIGRVTSIEQNHKQVEMAKKGTNVCIKIEPTSAQAHIQLGRHFEATDDLYSKISRESIDCLKEHFRDQMAKTDWQLIIDMKKVFEIV